MPYPATTSIPQIALQMLAIHCKHQKSCLTCELNPRNQEAVYCKGEDFELPGDYDGRCAYHRLALSIADGRALKMCPACKYFYKGSCLNDCHNDTCCNGNQDFPCDTKPACVYYDENDHINYFGEHD